jgi:hypothetical protein
LRRLLKCLGAGLENRHLQPDAFSTSANGNTTSGNTAGRAENDLAVCLAFLAKRSADLAFLAERWEQIPDAVRAGILAMVKASGAAVKP